MTYLCFLYYFFIMDFIACVGSFQNYHIVKVERRKGAGYFWGEKYEKK